MLFGFDLNHLFFFPLENKEARKNFLIGSALILAGFIIPILPTLLVIGYQMKIMRQVIQGEKPSLPDWGDWETLLKNGAKFFGVRLVYTLPLLLVMIPLFILLFALPFLAGNSQHGDAIMVAFTLAFGLGMICLMPFSLALMIVIPAAELHVAETNEFSAGFRVREWWPIFRKNIGGFLVAFLIYYGLTLVLSVFFQIIIMTLILVCILPFLMPPVSMYLSTVMYTAFAQAYRDGRAKQPIPAINQDQ